MKLNSASVNEALNQFSAQPIPANHPVVPRLANMFGDHTFFLDEEGLLIIEQAGQQIRGAPAGKVVKLASWSDENHQALSPHEPEVTDLVVKLAPDGSESSD
jgi:hypothetical protein